MSRNKIIIRDSHKVDSLVNWAEATAPSYPKQKQEEDTNPMNNKFYVIGYDADDGDEWYATRAEAVEAANKRLSNRYSGKTQIVLQAVAKVETPVLMAAVTNL